MMWFDLFMMAAWGAGAVITFWLALHAESIGRALVFGLVAALALAIAVRHMESIERKLR